jgi:hypothetical protein
VEELLKIDKQQEEEMGAGNKKKGPQLSKKIYPVSISFHQRSKLLAICLIDCDIKVY